jgi:hypothetical protein
MSLLSSARRVAGALAFAALWSAPVHAADPPAGGDLEAVTRALQAVVGVQVQAAQDARSADTLGRERSGSGVVIDADGRARAWIARLRHPAV